ncbi:phosphatase PAP2 family protein [Saccharomonospora sp. NPDC006951]
MLTPASASDTPLTVGATGRQRPRWWLEILFGLALFGGYLLGKAFPIADNTRKAIANGEGILAVERALGLDFELPANLWLAEQGWLRVAANYEYAFTYIATTLVLLVWVLWRRPEEYRWVRNSFVVMNLVAVACFWVFPVAPPRMLPDAGFVDTVRLGGTWGSWGSPMVDGANQFAAMPSLHIGWALWVSVVLARLSGGRLVQVASAVHVAVTFAVIIVTGNHYWLDALGAVAVVWFAVAATTRKVRSDRLSAGELAALRVDTPGSPQHNGRLILLGSGKGKPLAPGDLVARIAGVMPVLPRLARPVAVKGPLTRAHWAGPTELDWRWHVPEFDLAGHGERDGGIAALHRLVAELTAEPLPRDRPLWRTAVVTGLDTGVTALVVLTHPALAGPSEVATLVAALSRGEPVQGAADDGWAELDELDEPDVEAGTLAGNAGLAQLAADRPEGRGERARPRRFSAVGVSVQAVKEVAWAHGTEVTTVLSCAVAAAIRRTASAPLPDAVRVSVPRRRSPGAVLIEVPLGDLPEAERLARAASPRAVLSRRAVAAGWLVRLTGGRWQRIALLRYGGRAARQSGSYGFATVTDLVEGADPAGSRCAGLPVEAVFPIVPLAPGAAVAIGLTSGGLSVTADPTAVDDVERFLKEFRAVLDELRLD